ncbi:uncharacterized protein LOC126894561 isoform X2 [Daktulosphaira vitifoliae]|uniref:uncharacterized protein LOC126894561 isoform X2 n=1 Tax=Daktulosphaira vitifoliae TaxID=58002 RepID=UPI0021A9D554|nr:uncharacterized protein LOC126894561 isoform X2 [Daktulosphaira vitifoliae]
MYFFFFTMMYLASSLLNAFLFPVPPFKENSKLNDIFENQLKRIFQNNKRHDEGIDFVRFKNLLLNYKLLHVYNDNEIERLFTNEVENKLMNEQQFLNQAINVVKRIETLIENLYNTSLIHDKMTITELKIALFRANYSISDARAIQLINIERANAQDISAIAFRNIFAKLYVHSIHSIRENQEITSLKESFPLYRSLDPR